MPSVSFAVDFSAFIVVIGVLILLFFLLRWRRQFVPPYLAFPDIKNLYSARKIKWPQRLLWLSLAAFLFAYINPHLFIEKPLKGGDHLPPRYPSEGIAIYLVLDQSGSMAEKVMARDSSGGRIHLSKIDLVKMMSKKFILGDSQMGLEGRPNDMIGLVFFARAARVISPLTLDHEQLLQALNKFTVIGNKDQDGTSIGYALFKTVNLLVATRHFNQELIDKGEPSYTINSSVIILLTDGLQDPNPLDKGKRLRNMDVPEAAAFAKEQNIKLYIANVDPEMSTEKYLPYKHIMQRAAESTGGKFFMVDDATSLSQIYQEIDKLEKSVFPNPAQILESKAERPDIYQRVSFSIYFIALGLVCLMLGIILDTIVFKRIP